MTLRHSVFALTLALALAACQDPKIVTVSEPAQLSADACASAAVIYSGSVAGSYLTTIGAIRAMPLFAEGDLWAGDPADRKAVLCYVDVEISSSPPPSGTVPPALGRDILVVIDGQPGIELLKAGPRDEVPVVAP